MYIIGTVLYSNVAYMIDFNCAVGLVCIIFSGNKFTKYLFMHYTFVMFHLITLHSCYSNYCIMIAHGRHHFVYRQLWKSVMSLLAFYLILMFIIISLSHDSCYCTYMLPKWMNEFKIPVKTNICVDQKKILEQVISSHPIEIQDYSSQRIDNLQAGDDNFHNWRFSWKKQIR